MKTLTAFQQQVVNAFEKEQAKIADSAVDGRSLNYGSPFRELTISLADLGTPIATGLSGAQLLMLREGSTPNARVDVDLGGSIFQRLYPGSRLVCDFKNAIIRRPNPTFFSSNNGNVGYARLLALAPGINFIEPSDDSPSYSTSLLGSDDTVAVGEFVSFPANNYRAIRVFISGTDITDYTLELAYMINGDIAPTRYAGYAPLTYSGTARANLVHATDLVPLPALGLVDPVLQINTCTVRLYLSALTAGAASVGLYVYGAA